MFITKIVDRDPVSYTHLDVYKRQTNGCESFHSHFNQKFYLSHPSLYVFIDALQSIQIETYMKI